MKRYLVFAGDYYYPAGGWEDFKGAFDTIEEAEATGRTHGGSASWWHVIDTETMEEVAGG